MDTLLDSSLAREREEREMEGGVETEEGDCEGMVAVAEVQF